MKTSTIINIEPLCDMPTNIYVKFNIFRLRIEYFRDSGGYKEMYHYCKFKNGIDGWKDLSLIGKYRLIKECRKQIR